MNALNYVKNNPTKYKDPKGLWCECEWRTHYDCWIPDGTYKKYECYCDWPVLPWALGMGGVGATIVGGAAAIGAVAAGTAIAPAVIVGAAVGGVIGVVGGTIIGIISQ